MFLSWLFTGLKQGTPHLQRLAGKWAYRPELLALEDRLLPYAPGLRAGLQLFAPLDLGLRASDHRAMHVLEIQGPRTLSHDGLGVILGYQAIFSESVRGVDITDFALVTTGTLQAQVTGVSRGDRPRLYNVLVHVSGEGTLRLDVIDDGTIRNRRGSCLGGPGPGNGNFSSAFTTFFNSVGPRTLPGGTDGSSISLITPVTNQGGPQVANVTPERSSDGRFWTAVIVDFTRPILASTFTPDDATLIYTASCIQGDLSALDTVPYRVPVSVVEQLSATRFRVGFESLKEQWIAGLQVFLGPDIRDLANNPMDQDNDGIPGEVTDAYRSGFGLFPNSEVGPWITNTRSEPAADGSRTDVTIEFSGPIDASTFSPEDVRINYLEKLGPGLEGIPVPVAAVEALSPTTFRIRFQAPVIPGYYRISIGPDIRNVNNQPMNQDHNTIPGEVFDRYVWQFMLPPPVTGAD